MISMYSFAENIHGKKIIHLFLGSIFILALIPRFLPEFPFGDFGKERLLITCQATTGPEFVIKAGQERILKIMSLEGGHVLPRANETGIVLQGITPYDLLPVPDCYYSDYIVHGEITGYTGRYIETGHGTAPVFRVEKISVTGYIPMILYSGLPAFVSQIWLIVCILYMIYLLYLVGYGLLKKRISGID